MQVWQLQEPFCNNKIIYKDTFHALAISKLKIGKWQIVSIFPTLAIYFIYKHNWKCLQDLIFFVRHSHIYKSKISYATTS